MLTMLLVGPYMSRKVQISRIGPSVRLLVTTGVVGSRSGLTEIERSTASNRTLKAVLSHRIFRVNYVIQNAFQETAFKA